jgi:hypothetical protein
MVTFSPLGTFGRYWDTGSLNRSFPSWARSMISADVLVLVFEAIRKCVSAAGGVCVPSLVVPTIASKFPCGVRSRTIAPGISSSLAAAATAAWNAV